MRTRIVSSLVVPALLASSTLLLSVSARAQLPGGRRVAVIFAVEGEVPTALLDELRRKLDAPVAESGFEPTAASDYVDLLPQPTDPSALSCQDDSSCLATLRNQIGVPILLWVELRAEGGMLALSMKAWSNGRESGRVRAKPKPRDAIAGIATKAASLALNSLDKKLAAAGADRARDMGRAPPTVPPGGLKKPQPRDPGSGETAAAGGSTHDEADAGGTPRARYEFKEPAPEDPGFRFEVGAWGGLVPIRYNRTSLRVGERLPKQRIGDIGAGASVAFRIPWKKLPDLYQTNRFTYVLAAPLTAWRASVGFEKRFKGDLVAPYVGGGGFLTAVSLPVPTDSGGEKQAGAVALGMQGWLGAAFYVLPNLALHARAGFSASTRKLNQFESGSTTYYALDAKGRVWKVSLIGVIADVGVTFEI